MAEVKCNKCFKIKEANSDNFQWRNDTQKWKNTCKHCISAKNKKNIIPSHIDNLKLCWQCNIYKPETNKYFFFMKRDNAFSSPCKDCRKKSKQIKLENETAEHRKIRKKKEKEYNKIYQQENKEIIRVHKNEYNKDYYKNRRITDISFKLRRYFSTAICYYLKQTNSSKNDESSFTNLNYTVKDLIFHLEKQFEPWMTWQNYGKYNKMTWDNNDPKTWTWNIDHIIPQSDLLYSSMEDDNFKKCWALTNLRPFSAKQNLLDGTSKIRHKK
jgi:hypothetical protein